MKKLLIRLVLVVSLLWGCGSAPIRVDNDWTDSRPGTIFITGNLSDVDFQAFYNQTLDPKIRDYTIILNTNGGGAQACIGIMSRITELQKRGITFRTEVYSKAYSAGAFIWMMGDHKVMHRGSSLMWHTMAGQGYNDGKELPGAYGEDRQEMFEGMDNWVADQTAQHLPFMDPMTRETMLWYTGMTFVMAEDAFKLRMVDELVDN